MMLHDNETKIDLLNAAPIATTIVKLIKARADQPITIGVHGDWGAGKSSVLEMIEAQLVDDSSVCCIKFNGWRFQGFEDAKIALIESIVTQLIEQRGLLQRASAAVKDILSRIDTLKLTKKLGGLALTWFSGIPTADQIQSAVALLGAVAADPAKFLTKDGLKTAATEVLDVLKPASESKSIPKEIAEFRKAFEKLLQEAGVSQLVVLVDDLDRCLPETAIETLEAIRLFLFMQKTAFIVAADEGMIEYSVRKHFPDLPESTAHQGFARQYLEKLIQVPLRIPALGLNEARTYIALLLIGAELGENADQFDSLLKEVREKHKRPWEGSPLDHATVKKCIPIPSVSMTSALTMGEQIAPMLVRGTSGNPRQIKRFLNTLLLRISAADARGFGGDVHLPQLAKLLLAERFLPDLFTSIAELAGTSSDGKCKELADAEKVLEKRHKRQLADTSQGAEETKGAKHPQTTAEDGSKAASWLSSEESMGWLALEPQLGHHDLRPYLFVSRDRRDFMGQLTLLGKLAAVAERLMGDRITVATIIPELGALAKPEAASVFRELRERIVRGGEFLEQPAGIEGMKALVEAHPQLQSLLVDLLEELSPSTLGTWAGGGWVTTVKDRVQAARLGALKEKWVETGSPGLKASLKTAKLVGQKIK